MQITILQEHALEGFDGCGLRKLIHQDYGLVFQYKSPARLRPSSILQ
jgi:hypothetical protein